ncbi:MAG: DUF1080 domain-containing protein [Candidatus Hydrogenedentes bacterium]|nr:DUF1080 domain-containing protein [Candidatus Hydrogenedentota bacterium]
MKLPFLVVLAILTGLAPFRTPAESPADWKSLFDGTTFDGWEGDLTKFRIDDGAIVAGSLSTALDRNYFLCTTERYDHFELELKVKLVGEDANAGIQIRTERIPSDTEVIGYQADMGQHYWGCLYDESRRKRVLQQPAPELIEKTLKKDDWNDYRIRCEGNRIQLWLNGVQTVDYREEENGIPQTGIIAVQIHSGKPAEASYRDIRIRKLPAPK